MGKRRNENNDENLRGLLRQLRSENKHLKRQVLRLSKQLARQPIESIEEETVIEPDTPSDTNKCLKCGKALILIDLGIRKVLSCRGCGQRITLKD